MATVTVTETGVRVQVNLYRNMNGTPEGGTKVTVSGWSITNIPDIIPGRRVLDEDVTALLSPEDLAEFSAILDKAEAFLKQKWSIP